MSMSRTEFAVERGRSWDEVHRHYFPDYDARWIATVSRLRRVLEPGARVLDLGCGPGTLTGRLANGLDDARVAGVDLDPLLIELAREIHGDNGIDFIVGDVASEPTAAALVALGPFDAVVSSAFVHYFHPEQLVELNRLCASLLAPAGLLVTAERFAAETTAAPADEARSAAAPWGDWWAQTRGEAGAHGFTAVEVPSDAGRADPPPLTLHAYRRSLETAGFADVGVIWEGATSTVVSAVRGSPGVPGRSR